MEEEKGVYRSIYRHTFPDISLKKSKNYIHDFREQDDQGKEALLVSDIFNNLLCIHGDLIYPKESVDDLGFRRFGVDSSVNSKFIPIISECLETAKLFGYIQDALQNEEHLHCQGKANQGLAQCLNLLSWQYKSEVVKLIKQHQKESMTLVQLKQPLNKFNFWLSELVRILRHVNISILRGGMTFSYVHEELCKTAGNPERYELLKEISIGISKPFFETLNQWIFCGVLNDPKFEFFIQAVDKKKNVEDVNESLSDLSRTSSEGEDGESWFYRHSIQYTELPSFIDKQLAEMILKTGLYVKILAQCGSKLDLYKDGLLTYSPESDAAYIQRISEVYQKTSAFLLDFLVKEFKLYDHINCLKTFMMINQRDFITNFIDSTPALFEFYDADYLQLGRFQNLLEAAVGLSSISKNPLSKNLRVSMHPSTLLGEFVDLRKVSNPKSDLSILDFSPTTFAESFVLDYDIKWPINLVLNDNVMKNTKLLFRHIFQCTITESKLSSIWGLKNSIRGSLSKYSSFFLPALILGQNMIQFSSRYLMFIHVYVIEPAFHELNKNLRNARTLEDVMTFVEDCIVTCCNESLMRKDHLIESFTKISALCSEFGDFINSLLIKFDESMAEAVQDPTNPPKPDYPISTLTSINENFRDMTLGSNPMRRASSINSLLSINTNTYQIGVPAKMNAHQIFPPSMTQQEKRDLVELKRKVMEKAIDHYAELPEFHITVATFHAKFILDVHELLAELNQEYGKHCARLKTLANIIDAKGFYAEEARKIIEKQNDSNSDQQSERIDDVLLKNNNIFQSSFAKIEQECEQQAADHAKFKEPVVMIRPGIVDRKLENVSQWLSESRNSKNHDQFEEDEHNAV